MVNSESLGPPRDWGPSYAWEGGPIFVACLGPQLTLIRPWHRSMSLYITEADILETNGKCDSVMTRMKQTKWIEVVKRISKRHFNEKSVTNYEYIAFVKQTIYFS